jgi:hypothetical protein
MDRQDLKNLKRRYLVWLYKTAKEALDKIERKFTQLEIDSFILEELKKQAKGDRLKPLIKELENYIKKKQTDDLALKYENKKLKPDYLFLNLKLQAIEKAIIKELGKKALQEIKHFYEKEMTERILRSTEH